jgi:hypothetical protein
MLEGTCQCGRVKWQFDGIPEGATACNCKACRRYGALWAYGFEGESVQTSGDTKVYVRGPSIGFHFCANCGVVAFWRSQKPDDEGRLRVGFNLRLTEPGPIAMVPIKHFDGLERWEDLPNDGKCVKDLWY